MVFTFSSIFKRCFLFTAAGLRACVRVGVCVCLLTQVWLYELVRCNACSSGSLKRLKGNVEEHLEFVTGAVGHIQSIGLSEAAEMAKNMFEMCQ